METLTKDKKFTGSYEATTYYKQDGEIDSIFLKLNIDQFIFPVNMGIDKDNGELQPWSFYYSSPNEWTCPTCRRSHWYDDRMDCEENKKMMFRIWEQIKDGVIKSAKENMEK